MLRYVRWYQNSGIPAAERTEIAASASSEFSEEDEREQSAAVGAVAVGGVSVTPTCEYGNEQKQEKREHNPKGIRTAVGVLLGGELPARQLHQDIGGAVDAAVIVALLECRDDFVADDA